MKNLKIFLMAVFLLSSWVPTFGKKTYQLKSPDGKLELTVDVDKTITYSLTHEKEVMIGPSPISMTLDNGKVFGANPGVKSEKKQSVNQVIESPFYKRSRIQDHYNELTLNFKDDYSLIFRAYDEGMAYRFVTAAKNDFIVKNEEVVFNFPQDRPVYTPYVRSNSDDFKEQFFNSFENTYTYTSLSKMNPKRLSFLPLVVEMNKGKKVCIAESDVESYPGMFLVNSDGSNSLKSVFAPYPKKLVQGGHIQIQMLVSEREPFIAKCKGKTNFPWRIAVVSNQDKELADNDMVYKLATPSRIKDVSWIKPGKVAWEWWNNWGLAGVDFKAGVNNETYMAYIDFASKNKIEYIILDEGWSVSKQADLFRIVPEIDLKKLIAYGKSKNVDLILWAGYYALDRDLERVCKHYSEMGIKGFKVDFMDRDDQPMVEFHYRAAEIAARYNMLLDFHGTYKPTGINRTYPNVINFEGVHGQEQMKWSDSKVDQVTYDVTAPYIRMLAGPFDYTQGAMRNGSKWNFRPINNEPMSQGTRCRQLAEYVVFESPLNMLCDSPTLYEKEQECTDFIAAIPTVWDNTIALNGEIANYISIARQKNNIWYVGSLTNWDARSIELDLSFLGEGNYVAEIFKDGANAGKIGSDYKKETVNIPANRKLTVALASGGGCAMKIVKN